jgi:hypothetical protein
MVAAYLSAIWPNASVGRGMGKDIQNVPFDVEVKARSGFQPKAVIEQIRKRTSISGELGFAVLRLNGQGEDAGQYACIIQLCDLLPLLELKYGHIKKEPEEIDVARCEICGSWMLGECKTCQPMITNAVDAV